MSETESTRSGHRNESGRRRRRRLRPGHRRRHPAVPAGARARRLAQGQLETPLGPHARRLGGLRRRHVPHRRRPPERLPEPHRPDDRLPGRADRHGRRRAHDPGADLRLRLPADHGYRHRRHLLRRHQDLRLVEALAPGLRGHPPGALALPRQRAGGARRRGRRDLRQEPLRRRRGHLPVPGHRLGADDGRRAADREDGHPRRPEVPPREHQDVDEAQGRPPSASASSWASSSA